VCEKAKLIRGDPPKIALKRRGSPLKTGKLLKNVSKKLVNFFTSKIIGLNKSGLWKNFTILLY
jgi:hypothetical protein